MNRVTENKLRKVIRGIIHAEMKESVSFGEFKKDALAWKAANFVYDKSRSGSKFSDLFNFLSSESNSDMTKSKLFTITRKLYRTGDFVIVDNPDWKRSVIYHKSYAPNT